MHSGRTIGWTGEIEGPSVAPQQSDHDGAADQPPPKPGRHRRSGAANPLPVIDPLANTEPVGGLHKFDLGMVPASVTPPRSWRRAAWFAVASSAATLGGLVLATSTLVNNSTRIEGLDIPMPRASNYPELPGEDRNYLVGDPLTPKVARPTGSVRKVPQLVLAPSSTPSRPVARESAPNLEPAPPGGIGDHPSAEPTSTARPPTTRPAQLLSLSDGEAVTRRSDEYFAAIEAGDLHRAYALSTGTLHADGFDEFAARYTDIASIEVVGVYAEANRTITTLRITRPDGDVEAQRRRLDFTLGDEPMVVADELAR